VRPKLNPLAAGRLLAGGPADALPGAAERLSGSLAAKEPGLALPNDESGAPDDRAAALGVPVGAACVGGDPSAVEVPAAADAAPKGCVPPELGSVELAPGALERLVVVALVPAGDVPAGAFGAVRSAPPGATLAAMPRVPLRFPCDAVPGEAVAG